MDDSAHRPADDVADYWQSQLSASGGQCAHVLLQYRIPQLPRVACVARSVPPHVPQFARGHGDDNPGAADQLVADGGEQELVESLRILAVRVGIISDDVCAGFCDAHGRSHDGWRTDAGAARSAAVLDARGDVCVWGRLVGACVVRVAGNRMLR